MPSKDAVLALYRTILREGHKFHNYNLREYVKRRARDGFREMQGIQDAQAADAAYATGKQSVDMIRRQAIIYSMYGRPIKNVIELEKMH